MEYTISSVLSHCSALVPVSKVYIYFARCKTLSSHPTLTTYRSLSAAALRKAPQTSLKVCSFKEWPVQNAHVTIGNAVVYTLKLGCDQEKLSLR